MTIPLKQSLKPERVTESAVLDLRELPPPEPLIRALAALEQVPPGGQVIIQTRFRPAHLIDQLEARGCTYQCVAEAGGWRTSIQRAGGL